jgi:hypothetical protein
MSAAMAQQETVLYDIDFSAPKHTLNARPATGGTLDRIDRINRPTWEEGKVLHFSVTANYLTGRWTCRMDDVVVFDSSISGIELRSIRLPSHCDAVVIQAVSLPLPVSNGSGNVWVLPDPSDRL